MTLCPELGFPGQVRRLESAVTERERELIGDQAERDRTAERRQNTRQVAASVSDLPERDRLLRVLAVSPWISAAQIQAATGVGKEAVNSLLEELQAEGLAAREPGWPSTYALSRKASKEIQS